MGTRTKIEWATHTFNPVLGCSKIASGCLNCYAATMAGRLGVVWGLGGTRRRTAESTWRQVERWNRKAACRCRKGPFDHEHEHWCPQRDRPRVFPSLCDPFEDWDGVIQHSRGGRCLVTKSGRIVASNTNPEFGVNATMADVRRDFFALVDRTPNLDWLLLTKRPENVRRMWPCMFGDQSCDVCCRGLSGSRDNVWLIFSASDQASLEAGLPHLLACRDLTPVLGLSLEPLIGPVDLMFSAPGFTKDKPISWCVVGGESGPHARPMEIAWLESIAEQCRAAGVPLFVKQDSGPRAGQQGRIPDTLWSVKQFPRREPEC